MRREWRSLPLQARLAALLLLPLLPTLAVQAWHAWETLGRVGDRVHALDPLMGALPTSAAADATTAQGLAKHKSDDAFNAGKLQILPPTSLLSSTPSPSSSPTSRPLGQAQDIDASVQLSIVTADTRRLPETPSMNDVFSLFAVALQNYSISRNHEVTRLVYKTKSYHTSCEHPLHGKRHASWCKLLAVHRIMKSAPEGSLVMWMDSDAGVASSQLDLISLLERTWTGKVRHPCQSAECMEHKRRSCLLVTANWPAEGENCMASIFFIRNNACGREALRRWWNVGICPDEFPWEQRALNSILYPASFGANQGWKISQLAVGPNYRAAGQPFVHYGHTHKPQERLQLSLGSVASFFGGEMPNITADFTRLYEAARNAQIDIESKELHDLSWDLAGPGNTSGLDLAPWLDPVRRQKLFGKECFYMGYSPLTP